MWYSRRTALALAAVLTVVVGCKKNEPGPAVPAVAPEDPSKTQPEVVTEPEETVDLTDYLIRASIRLPMGTTVRSEFVPPARPLNKLDLVGTYILAFSNGPRFGFQLAKSVLPMAQVKAELQSRLVAWVKEEPEMVVAEVHRETGTGFEFAGLIRVAGETYQVRSRGGVYARADVDRMVRAATSLTESSNAKEALAADQKARESLARVGCPITEVGGGRKLVITGDRVTDADLMVVKDIAGIHYLVLMNAPKLTPKGIEALTACRRVEEIQLSGPGITDPLVAPLARLSTPNRVFLSETSVSDLGLQFLGAYRDLRVLGLSRSGPGSKGFELNGTGLGSLKGAQKLESLLVSGHPVTDECIEHLTKVKSLQQLTLRDTKITDAGIRLLEAHPGLQEIEITHSPLRGGGLSNLAELPALTRLTLNGIGFTDAALDRLRGTKLTGLIVQNTPTSDRGLAAIGEILGLKELDLSGTRMTDAGMAHVGRLEHLADLRLARTDLIGTGLTHLKARPALVVLDLTDTLVTDAVLADLNACPNLKTLHLDHTAVTDAGLAQLVGHKSLSEITLTGSGVTRAGVEQFKAARPTTVVEWVEPPAVADPKPVPPPVAIDKLPPADPAALVQKYGGKLRHEDDMSTKPVVGLSLAGSAVTDEDLAHLRAWKQLQTVNLSDCKNVSDAGLAYLALLPDLAELNLVGSGVRGDGLVHLKNVAGLRVLDLRKSGATARQLAPLTALKDLERLILDPVADERVFRILAEFPGLKEIDLRGFPLTNRRLGLLQKMTGLERLEIRSNDISDRGLSYLKPLKHLKELRIDSDSVSDAGLQSFAGMTGLKALDLAGRRITDVGFQHFRECKDIERVRVERTALSDGGLGWFKGFVKLIELELRFAAVTDKGIDSLAELNQLELIDLTGCPITDDGLKSFKALDELRKLVLDHTRITGRGFKAIEKLPRLSRVQMTHCPVTDLGLEGLSHLETLEQLGLDDTPVTDEVLGYLRILPNLKGLSLIRAIKLTDKAVDILKACPALTEVNLRGSGVSAKAAAELKKKDGLTVIAD